MGKNIMKTACALVAAAALALAGCVSTGATKAPIAAGSSAKEAQDAIELAQAMGYGINLGNTMEAYGRPELGTGAPTASYETFWGQPVTTRAIVASFKKAGFDTLRIPVAWTNAMDYEKGDYTIRGAYLDRVGEIIDYALAEGMYVVVNDHWDGSWWGMFGSASEDTRKAAMELYVSMWSQVAKRFSGYSKRLVFESANEELGNRLNDKDVAKDSGTLAEDQCYETTNQINQAFVDTVRKAGGDNADRFLLIAGYNTDIAKTCDPRFKMPADTAKGRLLVSVHYYEPSDYCTNPSVGHWGSREEYAKMNSLFKKMTQFTKAGYGVVVGEYAVSLKKDGSIKDNTLDYIANLLDNCEGYGYCPVLWDCSSLFKRDKLAFMSEDAARLFSSRKGARQGKSADEIATSARISLGGAVAAAKEAPTVAENVALAWIMYNAGDWGLSYSVGDKYNPSSKSDGLVATDVPVTGAGIYTVALDFTGTGAGAADGVGFAAIGIANGEKLFPGYVIDIKQVLVNGAPYELSGLPYTTSDDALCTRVNLFNSWVAKIPAGIRVASGDASKASACLLDKQSLGKVRTISVTFEYRPQ